MFDFRGLIPPESCKPNQMFLGSNAHFPKTTNYRDDYCKRSVSDRVKPIKANGMIERSSLPMESLSTHRQDYIWKNPGK